MITQITLQSIRAYSRARADLPARLTVFFGPNGAGKTTFLEAASLLASLRSFRTPRIRETIQAGQLSGTVEGKLNEQTLRIELRPESRTLIKDGKTVTAAAFSSGRTAVALAPEHQTLISGGAEERRRFLDLILFSQDHGYADTARKYRRALQHKQALLREKLPQPVYLDQVSPWNVEIAQYGEEIRTRRRALVLSLRPRVAGHYRSVAPDGGEAEIRYEGKETPLAEEIASRARLEHAAARALCGPHRDDLAVFLREQPADTVASHGERASLLLSLKLSELDAIEEEGEAAPFLVLDDVGATLDGKRRERLFEKLSESPRQAIFSTAEESVAEKVRQAGGRVLTKEEGRDEGGFSFARWCAA